MAKIEVMVFEPGKPGELKEIEDSLESMQKVVGGYIEQVTLAPRLACICNEEGKLHGLPPNRWGFCGTIFLVHQQGASYQSLTEKDKQVIGRFVREDKQLVL